MSNFDYLDHDNAMPMYKQIADFVLENKATRILDLGCGKSHWLHFIPSDYNMSVVAVDSDEESIEFCKKTYKNNQYTFVLGDCFDMESNYGEFDCVVLGGIVYYCSRYGETPTVEDFVDSLVERYAPKNIIVQDPRHQKAYKTPDYIFLQDKFAYEVRQFNLDIRMGERLVYNFFTDTNRPKRKVKADFVDDGHNMKQPDFDVLALRHGAYIINTEVIDSDRDGRVTPARNDIDTYVSVSAGFKSLYKAALDWKPGKEFKFIYVDISPTSIDYRMFLDACLAGNTHVGIDHVVDMYKEFIDDRLIHMSDASKSADVTIREQLDELDITQEHWHAFLEAYAQAPKRYIKLDLINNPILLYRLLKDEPNVWLWFSNAFDWHQFRHMDDTFAAWENYFLKRKDDIELHGHRPPFTSSSMLEPKKKVTTLDKEATKRRSLVNTFISDYCKYVSKDVNGVYISDVVEDSVADITNDIMSALDTDPTFYTFLQDQTVFKHTKFNYCMYNNARKYKIFLGINKVIARKNFEVAEILWPTGATVLEGELFRIESYPFVQGIPLSDWFVQKTAPADASIEDVFTLVSSYIEETYSDIGDTITYPCDMQISNFILDDAGKLVNIDFDYITKSNKGALVEAAKHYVIDMSYKNRKYNAKWWKETKKKYTAEELKSAFHPYFEVFMK